MASKTDRETTYDIISVDWNKEQTKLWRHYVEKSCPTANIITIPDNKPIPWNWSSGKLDCFKHDFKHPGRVMYMDTDTIVMRDLEYHFDRLEKYGATISASSKITAKNLAIKNNRELPFILPYFALEEPPVHYSTGFMVFLNEDMEKLHEGWTMAMEFQPLRSVFQRNPTYEEIAFAFWIAVERYKIIDMSFFQHANILRGAVFGENMPKRGYENVHDSELPDVIHYHKPARLRNIGLGRLLDV